MGLYAEWQKLSETAAQASQEVYTQFWTEYFSAETENYRQILASGETVLEGTVEELAAKFSMAPVAFSGFIDGINTSLKEEIDLDSLEASTQVKLDIDLEKLYFNMHAAKAQWLYELPEWDDRLSQERRREITKDYRASVVFVKEETIGRNDPCPCGSGKKYKKCCGKNA